MQIKIKGIIFDLSIKQKRKTGEMVRMKMKTAPQHIQDKANAMIAKGAKMSFEAICAMYMKSETKLAKKSTSKKEAAKWENRTIVNSLTPSANPSIWLAEKNRENAMKNLPSSMRQ